VVQAETIADEAARAEAAYAAGDNGEQMFQPRTGGHCSWCDFRRHCPRGQQAAPDVEPWAALS
jgi:putative RecB family exonuclease